MKYTGEKNQRRQAQRPRHWDVCRWQHVQRRVEGRPAGAMKLVAAVLLLVVVYTVALELLLPAWKRLLSVPNLNKPAP